MAKTAFLELRSAKSYIYAHLEVLKFDFFEFFEGLKLPNR